MHACMYVNKVECYVMLCQLRYVCVTYVNENCAVSTSSPPLPSLPPPSQFLSGRILYTRQPTAPSIPATGQCHGYEEGDDGKLVPQEQPPHDPTMGPAYYDTSHVRGGESEEGEGGRGSKEGEGGRGSEDGRGGERNHGGKDYVQGARTTYSMYVLYSPHPPPHLVPG